MSRKLLKRRQMKILLVLTLAALIVSGTFAFAWHQLREKLDGNYPITFYGRVADSSGTGISGVSVRLSVAYSPSIPKPGMYGRQEKYQIHDITTDADGNFVLNDVRGFKISIKEFRKNGRELDWAFSPRDPRNPRMSYVYHERTSAASIPSTPDKRITFYLAFRG
jgi:hypothetical protein